ncbi:FAD-dependent oxidoreductase [uncultured Brevibacillus sp.]|uniref:FAD-dependent oxidoreductase n=1 Tax=uncultured Brevibacillus sp. TaxID=169970 RepID=UPI0025944D54|nr:FAD-dependent oxidoreductase [uncultured Brevibacillus sp.]
MNWCQVGCHLLPGEDNDIAGILEKSLRQSGVEIHLESSVESLDRASKTAHNRTAERVREVQADAVLVAIGRKPRVSGIGLELAGGFQLAHVAFHEGEVATLGASGEDVTVNFRAVPRCIYTSPEVASVGLTERQARDQYEGLLVGEFPFSANVKAMIVQETAGKVKVLVEPVYHEIVGVTLVGPRATELIGQAALLLHAEMTADAMESFIAPHPTLSEALLEAVRGALGHAVHS